VKRRVRESGRSRGRGGRWTSSTVKYYCRSRHGFAPRATYWEQMSFFFSPSGVPTPLGKKFRLDMDQGRVPKLGWGREGGGEGIYGGHHPPDAAGVPF
jgi:hypothetical protein